MLVTWLGHAQLFINAANRSLLIDPWFAEPIFKGRWFRYPPPPYPNASTVQRPDFLLLSDARLDHSAPETLDQLPKDLPTFALRVPSSALQSRLDLAGFSNVRWVAGWETFELSPGLKVTFVPHDQGQSLAATVIEAEGVRLVHGNFCSLSVAGYREVVERLGKIDLAFLPSSSASIDPTDFATLEPSGATKKAEGIQQFLAAIEGLQPAEAAPFASGWALLDPAELCRNFLDRPTPEETLKAAMPIAGTHGTHLLHLEPGDEWTQPTGVIRKGLTAGWGYDAKSIERYATTRPAAKGRASPATPR